MGTINNFGGNIGKQQGDPSSFNNFGCTIGEQVINNREKSKERKEKDEAEFNERMRKHDERMAEFIASIMRNI